MVSAALTTALKISVSPGVAVSALSSGAPQSRWALVYAPGAGSNLSDPFGAYLTEALDQRGAACLRFQFPYSEAGRPAPDRNEVLEATWRAAIEAARPLATSLIAGGRSMGGRIASQVAAGGVEVQALALFSYPLHPPKRPQQRRDAHFEHLQVPTLFCSGDRDPYAGVEELEELVRRMPAARLRVLPGADHGFNVLKSSGRTRPDVWRQAVEALLAFAAEIEA